VYDTIKTNERVIINVVQEHRTLTYQVDVLRTSYDTYRYAVRHLKNSSISYTAASAAAVLLCAELARMVLDRNRCRPNRMAIRIQLMRQIIQRAQVLDFWRLENWRMLQFTSGVLEQP